MFKKPINVGTQYSLGSKDKRRLRGCLSEAYPNCKPADLDILLGSKSEHVTLCKISSSVTSSAVSATPQTAPQRPATGSSSAASLQLGSLSAFPHLSASPKPPSSSEAMPSRPASSSQPSPAPSHSLGSVPGKCTAYVMDGVPILVEFGSTVVPTVYGLWKCPDILRSVVTHSLVSKFILNGADLMLPGVIQPKTEFREDLKQGEIVTIRAIHNRYPFAVGRLHASLNAANTQKGKAVELIHYFGDHLWQFGPRTIPHSSFAPKIIAEVTQQDGDVFCASDLEKFDISDWDHTNALMEGGENAEADGGADEPDANEPEDDHKREIKRQHECEPEAACEPHNQTANPETREEEEEDDASQDQARQEAKLTPAQMDVYLEFCLLEALHTTVTDDQLPLDVSALYSKMVKVSEYIGVSSLRLQDSLQEQGLPLEELKLMRSRKLHFSLDIKFSSYKKLTKCIQFYTKKKLVSVKETRGAVSVVKVNRQLAMYASYTAVPLKDRKIGRVDGGDDKDTKACNGDTKASTTTPATDGAGAIELIELYQPSQKCLPVFQALDVKTGRDEAFTVGRCNEILQDYISKKIESGDETRTDTIRLDSVLAKAVTIKGETASEMKRAQLMKRYHEALNPCHKVIREGTPGGLSEAPLRKGPIPNIKISVEDRSGGRKHVTHILGLSTFLVDASALTEVLQKRLACSAATYELPGKAKEVAVMVQGKSATQSAEILVSQFGVPKKYILVETK